MWTHPSLQAPCPTRASSSCHNPIASLSGSPKGLCPVTGITTLREAQSWGSSPAFTTILLAQCTNQGSFYHKHCSLVLQPALNVNHISREINQNINPKSVLSLSKKRGFCSLFTSCTEDEELSCGYAASEMLQENPGGHGARSSTQAKGPKASFQRDLCGGEPPTCCLQMWSPSAHSARAGGGGPAQGWLTFPAGLHQAVPLPTAVTQQGEGAFTVACDVARGTHVQQLISHF